MAKIRKTGSIENAIMKCLQILSEDEIYNCIGKKTSFLRKCSDPNLKHQIDHIDSLKLDMICIKKGKAPPFLTEHEYKVRNKLENIQDHKFNDIDSMLVKSTILHGKIQETIKYSEDPKSDEGVKISKIEKKEIMKSIKNLEDKIYKIKVTVELK